MIPVSAKFREKLEAGVSEPRFRLNAILTDVAAESQGASASALDQFSADFPPAGTIDGTLHHLNYGPAITAEDRAGRSGWKSASASQETAIAGRAGLASGTFLDSVLIDDGVRARGLVDNYLQDFETLAVGSIIGQDGWFSTFEGMGTAMINTSEVITGTQSLRLISAAAWPWGIGIARLLPIASKNLKMSFKMQRKNGTDGHSYLFQLEDVGPTNWAGVNFYANGSADLQTSTGITSFLWAGDLALHDVILGVVGSLVYIKIDGVLAASRSFNAAGSDLTRIHINAAVEIPTVTAIVIDDLDIAIQGYDEDLESRTLGPLSGQDGWTVFSGAGAINVVNTATPGLYGQTIELNGAASRVLRRSWVRTPRCFFQFKASVVTPGTTVGVNYNQAYVALRDSVAGQTLAELRFTSRTAINGVYTWDLWLNGGTLRRLAFFTGPLVGSWGIEIGTRTGGSVVRIWLDGRVVDQALIPSLQVDQFELGQVKGTGTMNTVMRIDALRAFQYQVPEVEWERVFDLGASPVSGRALLSWASSSFSVRPLAGPLYEFSNYDSWVPLRRVSAPQLLFIAQTFTATEDKPLAEITFLLSKVGAGAGPNNLFVELRDVDTGTGAPSPLIKLARGKTIPIAGLTSSAPGVEIAVVAQFPQPWQLRTGRTYALVWYGDWPQSDTVGASLGADASAPTYSGGSMWYSNDGATWVQVAGTDIPFGMRDKWSVITEYGAANRDSEMRIRGNPPQGAMACGFVLDRETTIGAARVLMRAQSGWAQEMAAEDLWFEIHRDDGTGRPSNEVLCSMTRRDAGTLTWSGTDLVPQFEFFVGSLGTPVTLPAGLYHLVVKGSVQGSDSAYHYWIGVDSSGSFSGSVSQGGYTWPIPWTAYPARAMIFSILSELVPYYRFEAAYSADGMTWSAFSPVVQNGSRTLNGSASFTGQLSRYWKVRALGCRCPSLSRDHPISPILSGITLKVYTVLSKTLTVSLGTPRTLSRFEVFAHPLEGGLVSFKYQTSADGMIWSDVEGFRLLEARRRGGGATASADGPVITTDGQYVSADLEVDLTGVTHIRLVVLDTGDGFARVIEIRAFRVVDFGDRVTGDPAIGQQADFTQRAFKGRTISLTLNNTDGYLSPLGTKGGFNTELGEGLRLIMFVSYQEALDEVRIGEFYVDNWKENPATALLNVAGRDISKKADIPVSTRYKSNKGSWEIFEYLMNLANIPSQWLAIDRTANRIKYFAPAELNAWQESKKIAEAAGFAQVFVDRDGYVYFRTTGTTAADSNVPLLGTATLGRRTLGPVVQIDGIYYCLAFGVTGTPPTLTSQGQLQRFDEATTTWTGIGGIISFPSSSIQGGAIYAWNGRIYYLSCDDKTVYSMAPGEASWTVEFRGLATTTPEWEAVVSIFGGCPWVYQEDNRIIIDNNVWGGNFTWALDFQTMRFDELKANLVDFIYRPFFRVVNYQDRYYGLLLKSIPGELWLVEWRLRRGYGSIANGVTYKLLQVYTGGPLSCFGVGWDGERGELYFMGAGRLGVRSNYPAILRRIKILPPADYGDSPSGTTENITGNLWGSADIGLSGGDAILFQEGVVTGFGGEILGSETSPLTRFFIYDRASGNTVVPGPVSPSNTEGRMLVATTRYGKPWAWGMIDGVKVYQFQTRQELSIDPDPVFTFEDAPDTLLISTQVDHGMDMGGDNRLINMATVKSEPLQPQALATVWQGENLPWSLAVTSRLQFKVKLTDPALNLVPSISTNPPGLAVMTVEASGLQVEVNVAFPSPPPSGLEITAISISGNPLLKTSTYLRTTVGKASSIERFGIRHKTIENDYVYDPISASMMGAWLVTTGQDQKAKAEGVNTMGLWIIELLDVIRIIDSRSGMDAEFFVTGYNHRYRSQKSTLTLVVK